MCFVWLAGWKIFWEDLKL